MAETSALYIRPVEVEDLKAKLSEPPLNSYSGLDIRTSPRTPWTLLEGVEGDALPAAAKKLSAALDCTAIGVWDYETSPFTEVTVYREGKKRRRLRYCADEGGWTDVDGRPRRWESALFKDADTQAVEELEADGDDPDGINRRAIDSKSIKEGARLPSLDHERIVHALGVKSLHSAQATTVRPASPWSRWAILIVLSLVALIAGLAIGLN